PGICAMDSLKLIVFSDSHGDFRALDRLIQKHLGERCVFLHLGDGPLVDIGGLGIPYGSSGKLFSSVEELSNDRYGKVMTFDLKPYGIYLEKEGDGFYMPLQTARDLILSYYVCYALYNGECIILAGGLDDKLSEIYHSATGTRSEEYAKFAYNELCFALDYEYGLKEVHGIESFDEYFFNVGLSKALQSTDPLKADVALHKAITLYLDDLHSQFVSPSYQTDADAFEKEVEGIQGPSNRSFRTTAYKFRDARAAAYPDGIPPYEEVGNTAYITFDEFTDPMPDIDYLSEPTEEELTDTIRLMQYACDRILRENSPIENVVMDLSMNTGGAINEASYVIGTYLGNGDTNVINTMTGAASTAVYKIDTNRDGNFDEQDTLSGKGLNLYCLTSPVSFSCGNLVPNSFMMSPDVTLVGMTSGGGSCSVHTLSTAGGSIFNISSYQRMSVFKNGSYYDIDRGADPDLPIRKYEDFYDRQSLTKYINGIY
ncbi:MAG: hypothetical protein IJT32_03790, partial [Lachnospiraceae bacterium]|nr:hypothetical protein [Lachnospiraceae bacterium]